MGESVVDQASFFHFKQTHIIVEFDLLVGETDVGWMHH